MPNQLFVPDGLSKFSSVNHDGIRSFVASIPRTFYEASKLTCEFAGTVDKRVLGNRVELAGVASRFHHEADTLTPAVSNAISYLSNRETIILVSTHQPNLFAYSGIFKKIVLLESLKQSICKRSNRKVINLFLFIDHDFMDERWVRVAQLPSVNHSDGILEIRHKLKESQRWTMICNAPIPDDIVLGRWKSQIQTWIKSNTEIGQDRISCIQRFAEMWHEFESACNISRTYADMNSFFISNVVNKLWDYGTVFLRLSQMSTAFLDGYRMLLSKYEKYSHALREAEQILLRRGIETGVSGSSYLYAPLWIHCSCGSKAPARLTVTSSIGLLRGACMGCRKEISLDLGSFREMRLSEFATRLSPRAIPIPILFARELGISCYASGTGGIGYLVDCSVVAGSLHVALPVIALWSSRDSYIGIAQRRALAMSMGKIEVTGMVEAERKKHLELESAIRSLLCKRGVMIQTQQPRQQMLAEIFDLKQQQRTIRARLSLLEKLRNATTISPCFVDYAVNFGTHEVERFWRHHLYENGDLTKDVKLLPAVA